MTVRVAVAGAGYWGVNHVRAFAAEAGARLVAVAEPDDAARARALSLAPGARGVRSVEELLDAPDVDAIVLATPATLHAAQATRALAAGKHVLVEKPLALTVADAEQVTRAAADARRVLMVGHLMVHHPAVAVLRALLDAGEIGDVLYLHSRRVNLGRLRRDESALWSFGPHDVSLILHLLGQPPSTVAAHGRSFLQPGVEDVVFLHLDFPDGKMAHVHLSWLDPRKERRLTIVGSRRMVELDDVNPVDKLHLYDKGYDRPPAFTQFGEYLTVRHGDVTHPHVEASEPLALECRHFIECIARGRQPLTDGAAGVAVVRVLAAAERSLAEGGRAITIA